MFAKAPREDISTFYRPIQSIAVTQIKQMYELYASFYENTSLDIFVNDLNKKTGVILLVRKADGQVVGFSTLCIFDIKVDARRVRGIFSGDTIVAPAYWGKNGLASAFHRRVIIERIKHPFVPFYWFLISKGYKTYLLMTNNFYNYYPKVGGNRPGMDARFKRITQAYCDELFPGSLDREKMILNFGDEYARLKQGVAPITSSLRASNRHVAFFEGANPGWHQGHELPCLASCDFESVFRSLIDAPLKWLRKRFFGANVNHGPTQITKPMALDHEVSGCASDADDEMLMGSKAPR